jgi:hypothetical protein
MRGFTVGSIGGCNLTLGRTLRIQLAQLNRDKIFHMLPYYECYCTHVVVVIGHSVMTQQTAFGRGPREGTYIQRVRGAQATLVTSRPSNRGGRVLFI